MKKILIIMLLIGLVLATGAYFLNLANRSSTPQGVSVTSQVVAQTDKQEYASNESIRVTIGNNSTSQITTYDQQTSCSVVKFEKQNGGAWEEIENCNSGAPNSYTTYAPQSEATVTVAPISGPWEEGVYRASLVFSEGRNFELQTSFVIYSSLFNVK